MSTIHQEVFVGAIGRSFTFDAWEPIHTEYSYKYLMSDVDTLAEETGYEIVEHMFDSRRWFVDSVWRVRKSGGLAGTPGGT